jgi:thioredoxin-like negative regulator of GroEL
MQSVRNIDRSLFIGGICIVISLGISGCSSREENLSKFKNDAFALIASGQMNAADALFAKMTKRYPNTEQFRLVYAELYKDAGDVLPRHMPLTK